MTRHAVVSRARHHLANNRFAGLLQGAAVGLTLIGAALVSSPAMAQAASPVAASYVAASQVAGAEAGPALWVVRDADSTLYLFGTVHVLKPDTAWSSARVDQALAASSDIWFEISNPEDTAAIVPLIQRYGISLDEPLSSLLTPTEMGELDAAARAVGSNISQMDPLRPWYAAVALSLAPLTKAGYDPASGVELVLKARALEAGKTIHGFETIEHQVLALATLPEAVQVDFLRSTLKDFEEAASLLDAMVSAWATGDVATLDQVVVQDMKAESPAIYDALLVRRNVGFADQIETLLAGSGTAFIAIGAGHLAGEDSVQAMLEARGVPVSRE